MIPEILASTIRVGVWTGKQVREQSLADYHRADILWVQPYADSERRADLVKKSSLEVLDKSKFK